MEMAPMERRPGLAAELTRRLEAMILAGEWKPGEQLPGQRQLAERLGVSMAAVREALAALGAAGLVDFRQGQGTFVCGIGEGQGSLDGWLGPLQGRDELKEFLEVRQELEGFAVRLAARRASQEQHGRLRDLVRSMRAALGSLDAEGDQAVQMVRYTESDLALHMTLVEAGGNRVLLRIMRALQASLQHYLLQVNQEHRRRGRLAAALETHERLVLAVVAADGEAAVRELETMLGRGNEYWGDEPAGVVAHEPR